MATVKTAISIERPLFEASEKLAREMKVSRSRLFTLALAKFLEGRSNEKLLAKINAAHAGQPAFEGNDAKLRRAALASHRQLIEGEW